MLLLVIAMILEIDFFFFS